MAERNAIGNTPAPDERLTRIIEMEAVYDRCVAATETLIEALRQFEALEADARSLIAYYESPTWLADFDADRTCEIPASVKRGILTEDAIYDWLTDRYALVAKLRAVAEETKI